MPRILLTAAIAITLGAPAFAQQQNSDPQLKAQVEQLLQKWNQATNEGDGQTMMSLQTPDSIFINAYGMTTVPERQRQLAEVHKMGLHIQGNVTSAQPLDGGNTALAYGTYHATYENNPAIKSTDGNWMQVLQKDGSDWKVKAMAVTRVTQPDALTGSSSGGTTK